PSASSGQRATGVFFDEYSPEGLTRVLRDFKGEKFKSDDCRKQAEKFDKNRFKKEMVKFVEEKWREHQKKM
ncbi:MAG: hypothetical protein Q8Q15_04445, partial [bacterium]|nr:hypothetical protein [bacterium]